MSKRLNHRKSRAGCSVCKSRHLKCDETGPPCAHCRVRDLDCDFEAPAPIDRGQVSPQGSSSPSPNTGLVAAVGSKRLELELLHQWTSQTYRSIVFQDGDDIIWQITVPEIAFQCDYLLYSVYAMAALHLSCIRCSSLLPSYRLAALEYQNLAITAFRMKEPAVTPESSQALFAFSALNLIVTMALPGVQVHDSDQKMVDNLNTLFELLRGTVSIFTTSRKWLFSGPFVSFIRRAQDLHRDPLDDETKSAFGRLRALRDEDYQTRSLAGQGAAEAVARYESMADAIDHLEHSFGLRGDHGQIVPFSWLAMLQLSFIDSIGRREPLPLLVTMHWAILLNTLSRDRWWAKSSGKTLVAEISVILLSSQPDWLPAITWVHSQVGLPPPAPPASNE